MTLLKTYSSLRNSDKLYEREANMASYPILIFSVFVYFVYIFISKV